MKNSQWACAFLRFVGQRGGDSSIAISNPCTWLLNRCLEGWVTDIALLRFVIGSRLLPLLYEKAKPPCPIVNVFLQTVSLPMKKGTRSGLRAWKLPKLGESKQGAAKKLFLRILNDLRQGFFPGGNQWDVLLSHGGLPPKLFHITRSGHCYLSPAALVLAHQTGP